MPHSRTKIVKDLKQYSNNTNTQTTYQRGNKRSVDQDTSVSCSVSISKHRRNKKRVAILGDSGA